MFRYDTGPVNVRFSPRSAKGVAFSRFFQKFSSAVNCVLCLVSVKPPVFVSYLNEVAPMTVLIGTGGCIFIIGAYFVYNRYVKKAR
jgi:hypothetical protein